MTTKGKVFVGCGVLLLIPIAALAALYVYVTRAPGFREFSARQGETLAEAREYAKNSDQNGCLARGLEKASIINRKVPEELPLLGRFVEECLEYSRKTENFCQKVPKVSVREFIVDNCRKRGKENDELCHVVYDAQTAYCLFEKSSRKPE